MGCIVVNQKIKVEPLKEKDNTFIIKSKTKELISINNRNYVIRNKSDVFDNYKMMEAIGKGAFGSVHKVMHLQSGLVRAMKSIEIKNLKYQDDDRTFLKEIEVLTKIEHPNIIKIYEYFKDETNYYLITEFVQGGQLLDYLVKAKSLNEKQVVCIMKQVLSAVYYLHSIKIVHRDIKPENIIVDEETTTSDEIKIKLIDFGTCNFVEEGVSLHLKIGTPYYMAPEVILKNYNEKCDIWSCGVLFYILLYGQPPFQGSSPNEIFNNVIKYEYKHTTRGDISEDAKYIIDLMLIFDYKKRPSAKELLQIKWFNKSKQSQLGTNQLYAAFNNLQKVRIEEKLQQATIGYIVHNLTTAKDIENLKNVFSFLDKDGDGRLSKQEITQGIKSVFGKKMNEEEIFEMADRIDHDMDGFVSWEEFIRVALDKSCLISEKNLETAFKMFDENGDGKLSIEEIKNILKTSELEYVMELIEKIDTNKDGEVDFNEFKELINKIIVK